MKIEPTLFGIGKKLEETTKERTQKKIEKERLRGLKKYRGEIEKTKEDIRLVELASELLSEECTSLGLEGIRRVAPEQIHFLSKENYENIEGDTSAGTYSRSRGEEITINIEGTEEKLALLRVVIHEAIHAVSFGKYGVKIDSLKRIKEIKPTRVGYLNVSQRGGVTEDFRYLNEAVAEEMAIEVVKKNIGTIKKTLQLTPDKTRSYAGSYQFPRMILRTIIKKIAAAQDEEYPTVWNRFKKGLINGEMMHLRDIQKVYGKQALRILAQLDEELRPDSAWDQEKRQEYMKRVTAIQDFFHTNDHIYRELLANSILGKKKEDD